MTTTTTPKTSLKPRTSSNSLRRFYYTTSFNTEHCVNERYPKPFIEQIPSIMLDDYPPKSDDSTLRSAASHHRFRTQPITLTEIHETDEENKTENDNQQTTETKSVNDFDNLEHLALADSIRRTTRKKAPLKNFLQRQRLKTTLEQLSETDGN